MPAKRERPVRFWSASVFLTVRERLSSPLGAPKRATREHTQPLLESNSCLAWCVIARGESEGHALYGAGSVDGRMGDPCGGGGVAARLVERSLRFRRLRSQRRQPYTSSPTVSATPSTVRSSRCIIPYTVTQPNTQKPSRCLLDAPAAFQRALSGNPVAW